MKQPDLEQTLQTAGCYMKNLGAESINRGLSPIIKCPICCSNDAHILWSASSRQAAQNFVLQEKQPERFSKLVAHIENLWGQNSCDVVRCDKCGFCFSNPYTGGDELFYSLAYDRSRYPTWKWEFQLTHDVLNKFSKFDFNLLEIGAGNGAFVKKVAEEILPKEKIICTEFSKYGRDQIEKFGLKCLSQDVRTISNANLKESFGVVCMFHVIEHLDNLDILFQKLNWLMKIEGSLFIAAPNPRKIDFNELNGALLDMPPNHIGRWNKECFKEIGVRNGFRIEDYKVEKSSLLSMVKQFVIYRFLRKSQQNGSLENHIEKIRNHYLHRIFQIIGVAVNLIMAIPTLTKKGVREGNSQWVHLIKVK